MAEFSCKRVKLSFAYAQFGDYSVLDEFVTLGLTKGSKAEPNKVKYI